MAALLGKSIRATTGLPPLHANTSSNHPSWPSYSQHVADFDRLTLWARPDIDQPSSLLDH